MCCVSGYLLRVREDFEHRERVACLQVLEGGVLVQFEITAKPYSQGTFYLR